MIIIKICYLNIIRPNNLTKILNCFLLFIILSFYNYKYFFQKYPLKKNDNLNKKKQKYLLKQKNNFYELLLI